MKNGKSKKKLALLIFTISLISIINLVSASNWCYQETANVSTACGGLNTGDYAWSGDWGGLESLTIDGDWNTQGGEWIFPDAYFYVNYTKPLYALNTSILQKKDLDGEMNLSIPVDCWNQSNYLIFSRYSTEASPSPIWEYNWTCWNGYYWKSINSSGVQPWYYPNQYTDLWEEAMIWDMSTIISLDNPLNNSYYTQNVNFNCSVNSVNQLKNMTVYVWNSTGLVNSTSVDVTGLSNQTSIPISFMTDMNLHWNCLVYDNQSNSYWSNFNNSFTISHSAPVVNLNFPNNNQFLNYKNNVFFNFTPSDSGLLDTCILNSNWSGAWQNNYTWINPNNGIMNYTRINLTDGTFLWNVWCNNSLSKNASAVSNYTLNIDTIYPIINITNVNTNLGTPQFTFYTNITEINLISCKYSIYSDYPNLTIDGLNSNITFNCSNATPTTTTYGDFTLVVYANDLAGNENSSASNFTTSPSFLTIIGSGGGGGGGGGKKARVVAIIKPIDYNETITDLQRAILYAEIKNITNMTDKTSDEQINLIRDYLDDLNLHLTNDKLVDWIKQFTDGQIEVIEVDVMDFNNYKLIKAESIFGGVFSIIPSLVNRYTLVGLCSYSDVGKNWSTQVRSSKLLSDCYIKEGNFSCKVVKPDVAEITHTFNDLNVNFDNFEGEVTLISQQNETTTLKIQYLNVINYCGEINAIGLNINIGLLIGIGIIIILVFVFIIYKFVKRGKNKKRWKRKK